MTKLWLHVSCTYRIIFNFSTRISETNVCWKSKIFRKSIIFSDLLKVLETRILSLDLEYLIYCGPPTRTNLKLVRSKISFHIRMIFISNISISPCNLILWCSKVRYGTLVEYKNEILRNINLNLGKSIISWKRLSEFGN